MALLCPPTFILGMGLEGTKHSRRVYSPHSETSLEMLSQTIPLFETQRSFSFEIPDTIMLSIKINYYNKDLFSLLLMDLLITQIHTMQVPHVKVNYSFQVTTFAGIRLPFDLKHVIKSFQTAKKIGFFSTQSLYCVQFSVQLLQTSYENQEAKCLWPTNESTFISTAHIQPFKPFNLSLTNSQLHNFDSRIKRPQWLSQWP